MLPRPPTTTTMKQLMMIRKPMLVSTGNIGPGDDATQRGQARTEREDGGANARHVHAQAGRMSLSLLHA